MPLLFQAGEVRVEGQRPVIGGQRLLVALKVVERGALVVPGVGELRVEGQRPVVGDQRLLVALQAVERVALVVPDPRLLVVEGQRPVVGGQRLLVAAQFVAAESPGLAQASNEPGASWVARSKSGSASAYLLLRHQRLAACQQVVYALGRLRGDGGGRLARRGQRQGAQQTVGRLRHGVGREAGSLDALEVV